MANELINPEWLEKAKELIPTLTPQEQAVTFFACQQIEERLRPLVREQIIKGSIDKFEFVYNGTHITVSISRGKETSREIETKIIDYDKAVEFAKEHNFPIPMTPERVIAPELDKIKLESQEWFQNNVDQFVKRVKSIKTTKSYDKITVKESK